MLLCSGPEFESCFATYLCVELRGYAGTLEVPICAGATSVLFPIYIYGGIARAVHVIERFPYTVGVLVTVQALHEQFPSLLRRRSRPSTLPFLPGWAVGGPFAVFRQSCFVLASAVLTAVKPLLDPCLRVV